MNVLFGNIIISSMPLPAFAFFTWLVFLPIAIINGAIRNIVYKPLVGDLAAHQISTAIAITAFSIAIYLMLKGRLAAFSYRQLLLIGLLWLILTVLFEFGAGHYVFGNSWEKLLADYNIFHGRVWILVLLTELLEPVALKWFTK